MTKNVMLLLLLVATAGSPMIPSASATTMHKRTQGALIRGSVQTDCNLTTNPIGFTIGMGYIHGPKPPVVSQSSLTVRCSKGSHVLIGMDSGLFGSAAGSQFGTRSMKSADGSYLGYDLFHDSAFTSLWTNAGYPYVSPGDAGSVLPVWARVPTSQSQAKQGTYTDSVTVTVSF